MRIDRIKATIRYSADTGAGAWKTVDLGAEASLDETEEWRPALALLYAELGQELKRLWAANGNGHKANAVAVAAAEPQLEPSPAQEPPHFCQIHQTEFRRHENGKGAWYSHKTPDGAWCREK